MTSDLNRFKETRDFVNQYIPSVAHVEVLLLLAANEEVEWSVVEQISDELRSGQKLVADVLEHLRDAGLVGTDLTAPHKEKRYRFAPQSADLRRQVETLATEYQARRHSVVSLIYERSASDCDTEPTSELPD